MGSKRHQWNGKPGRYISIISSSRLTPRHRDLLGYIQQRDEVSISLARLASATGDVRERATRAQSESHVASRENTQLAGNIMDLVARVKEKRSGGHEAARGDDEDEATTQLKDELRRARQRWRVMKGITSGVVAGSGVDWARDETLRDLVLDPEDDDEDGVEV